MVIHTIGVGHKRTQITPSTLYKFGCGESIEMGYETPANYAIWTRRYCRLR
jgi:hypothetical protein